MASTVVAVLYAEVLARLDEYASEFMADFGLIIRRYWAGVYLQGLLLDGERKSIQPLAQRVNVPGWHGDTMQALQQFVNQSPWDAQAVLRTYRRLLAASLADTAGVIVIDDTGFAKKGRHSVGVTRQYSGTLGKTDNCQVAVSLHYAAAKGDYPLALRLFLPESWTSQPGECRPRAYHSSTRSIERSMRSRSTWWTSCMLKGCRIEPWWLTLATASASTFAADSTSAGWPTWSASLATKRF